MARTILASAARAGAVVHAGCDLLHSEGGRCNGAGAAMPALIHATTQEI